MNALKLAAIVILCLLFLPAVMIAQTGINTDGSQPDASAGLDVKFSNKGFLPPRVALTSAASASPVTSPATGLLVYNTNTSGTAPNKVFPGHYYWNGTRWVALTPPQGANTGDMFYWNGSQWTSIPAGLPGQYLQMSTSGIPAWAGVAYPTVTTLTVSSITVNSATCGGTVTSDGGSPVTERGVCWSTAPNPTTLNSKTVDGSGTGNFTSQMTGLSSGVTYYVRAYASNSAFTAYGAEQSFTTNGPCPGTPTVTYGSQVYNTMKIGTQCWLKENLNIGTRIDSTVSPSNNAIIEKWCYRDLDSLCAIYGAIYQWDEMMNYITTQGTQGICPPGWHIPSHAEWTTLTSYLGGVNVSGGKIKEEGYAHWAQPNTGATNSSGFTALPAGYRFSTSAYNKLALQALFWTTTVTTDNYVWYRQLDKNFNIVSEYLAYKSWGMSVRCLKD